MASVRVARIIDAAVEDIWPYLADAARWPEWMPGVESSAVTNGQEEGVGRRQHLEVSYGGHRGEIDLEVTEWEPHTKIGWVHLSDRIQGTNKQFARDVRTRVTLSPAAGATGISFEGSWEPVGLMGKMLSGTLIQSRANAMFERAAQNLERLARAPAEG